MIATECGVRMISTDQLGQDSEKYEVWSSFIVFGTCFAANFQMDPGQKIRNHGHTPVGPPTIDYEEADCGEEYFKKAKYRR